MTLLKMKLILHLALAYLTWPRKPAFIILHSVWSEGGAAANQPQLLTQISVGESQQFCSLYAFVFQQLCRSITVHFGTQSSVATGHPLQWKNEWKNTPDRDTQSWTPHTNRWPYRCAVDHEHLSEMGRQAFCCEMSGGGAVASDLLGWLSIEGLQPKRKIAGHTTAEVRLSSRMLAASAELQRAAFRWHLKPINVAESEYRNVCVCVACLLLVTVIFLSLLFSHHSNIGWQIPS